MVALAATDMDQTQVRRLHRLLAGELLPASMIEDPDEPGSLILRDASAETGCYMQLVHRGDDGEIVPGAPPGWLLDSWTSAAADTLESDAPPPARAMRGAVVDAVEIAVGGALVLLVGAAILSWLGVRGLAGVVGIVALVVLSLACFSGIAAEAGKQRRIVQ